MGLLTAGNDDAPTRSTSRERVVDPARHATLAALHIGVHHADIGAVDTSTVRAGGATGNAHRVDGEDTTG